METSTIQKFLDELRELCKKYGISIAHEDEHGSFILTKFSEYYIERLRKAEYDDSL